MSDVLVGLDAPDDAAVVRFPGVDGPNASSLALVLTTDFFTPIVDDPFTYGRIAAANSMSDVYAMGGTPRFALAVAAFPTRTLSLDILATILEGGRRACGEAGILVVGGHTVDDSEPKFGYCVIGTVDTKRIWRKRGARVGDALVLTKALGTGIIATALKRDAIGEAHRAYTEAVNSMVETNRRAMEAALPLDVGAATDITGYGLLGHLLEMLGPTESSAIDAELRVATVPVLPEVASLVDRGFVPGGTTANLAFVEPRCDFERAIPEADRLTLADAQTSGGLLLSMSRADAEGFVAQFAGTSRVIGTIRPGSGRIAVRV